MLTKEEFDYLKQFEDRFETAHTSNFARSIGSKTVEEMRRIYSRLIDKNYSMNINCGGCILTLLKKLYPYYNEYREIERNSSGQANQTEQNTGNAVAGEIETGDTKPVKRRVRSKSSNPQ